MVIKTESCFFSELRIYPGHGIRFARKDGKLVTFLNAKTRSMYDQKLKNTKLCWTQAWRRNHKKGVAGQAAKKKKTQIVRQVRGIAGLDLEKIKNMSTKKHKENVKATAEMAAKVKETKAAAAKKAVAAKPKVAAVAKKDFVKVPKYRRAQLTSARR